MNFFGASNDDTPVSWSMTWTRLVGSLLAVAGIKYDWISFGSLQDAALLSASSSTGVFAVLAFSKLIRWLGERRRSDANQEKCRNLWAALSEIERQYILKQLYTNKRDWTITGSDLNKSYVKTLRNKAIIQATGMNSHMETNVVIDRALWEYADTNYRVPSTREQWSDEGWREILEKSKKLDQTESR